MTFSQTILYILSGILERAHCKDKSWEVMMQAVSGRYEDLLVKKETPNFRGKLGKTKLQCAVAVLTGWEERTERLNLDPLPSD